MNTILIVNNPNTTDSHVITVQFIRMKKSNQISSILVFFKWHWTKHYQPGFLNRTETKNGALGLLKWTELLENWTSLTSHFNVQSEVVYVKHRIPKKSYSDDQLMQARIGV